MKRQEQIEVVILEMGVHKVLRGSPLPSPLAAVIYVARVQKNITRTTFSLLTKDFISLCSSQNA